MRHIAVTGATGFIGSHMVKRLVEQNIQTSIIVRDYKRAEYYLSDVFQYITVYEMNNSIFRLSEFFQKEQIDGIVHLATKYITYSCADDIEGLIKSNVLFGTQILEAMKLANVKNFINIGTNWQHYQNERYNPVNIYAATKQAFEDILHYYTQAEGIHAITVEICDTYGAKDLRNKVINQWKQSILNHNKIKLSSGEQKLDLVFIEDVIDAILQAVKLIDKVSEKEEKYEQKYAISSGRFYTLREAAEIFEQVYQSKLNIEWGAIPYRKREVFEPYCKISLVPGWHAKYDLKDGFKQMYQEEYKRG